MTPENQIMELLTRRRGRLFCAVCIPLELHWPNPKDISARCTRSAWPKGSDGQPARAAGAAGNARGSRRGDDAKARRSSQAASSSSSRTDRGSGDGALIPASAASHRSARLRIASAPFRSFVRAANRRQRSACALNSLASTSHLVPAMALAPCPMLTSREAGFGHGRSCEIVSPMSD